MIARLLRGGDLTALLLNMLYTLPGILLALSVHEYAHGYVSYRLGDPTAKGMGRLSLNPFRHLDPFGFLSMLLFGFGWARPVVVDSRFLKKPRRDTALISLAGPLSNFLLAFVLYVLLAFFVVWIPSFLQQPLTYGVYRVLLQAVYLNVSLCVFNLIPCPPLDGSKILYSFLPSRIVWKIAPYERYFPLILLALLYFDILYLPLSVLSDGILSLYSLLIDPIMELVL